MSLGTGNCTQFGLCPLAQVICKGWTLQGRPDLAFSNRTVFQDQFRGKDNQTFTPKKGTEVPPWQSVGETGGE